MKTFYYTVKQYAISKSVQVYSIVDNTPKIEMNIHGINLFDNTENKVREEISIEKGIDQKDIKLHIL